MFHKQEEKVSPGCIICTSIITMILFIASLVLFVDYIYSGELSKEKCNISDVIYPSRLPLNHSDFQGFKTCDCGKRCVSDLGICISVYGNIVNQQKTMMFRNSYSDRDDLCTKQEDDCPHGENVGDRLNAIENAINEAQEYIQMMNESITCYYSSYDNKLYFSNDFNENTLYVVFGFFCVFLIILSIKIFQVCREEKKIYVDNKNDNKNVYQLNSIHSH